MKYFIVRNGAKIGPLDLSDVIRHVSPDTLVWKEGMEDWQPASTFDELKDKLVVSPPLLPVTAKTAVAKEILRIEHRIAISLILAASVFFVCMVVFNPSKFDHLEQPANRGNYISFPADFFDYTDGNVGYNPDGHSYSIKERSRYLTAKAFRYSCIALGILIVLLIIPKYLFSAQRWVNENSK